MPLEIDKLRYPIGKFIKPTHIDADTLAVWIDSIKKFPERLKNEISRLTPAEFQKSYRPDGWTITQLVNHCADSHINSFVRFKLALTEDNPTIKPYMEDRWAALADSKAFPVASALKIIEGIHERWGHLLESLSDADLERTYIHPESGDQLELKTTIGIYAWHCNHHLAHIINAKTSK
ncbi:YfiT family bacillithiol transferase [Sphingobacterium humi]|uniref:Putative metal-dependent hydrolase n=1 Tax=Sphingobacterium humi TaxID=1796905 RepID=A0A6N8L7I6_9SPHI|nr:putative metal-dependent hydrolase [Sphingobacterium humi]MVZ63702.1 putative metal-dependent hydrolase [Sphingobacterium humi]